jgi:hypothetical protein
LIFHAGLDNEYSTSPPVTSKIKIK